MQVRYLFTLLLIVFIISCESTESAKTIIQQKMSNQVTAWNSGDLEGFMNGYWQSDSLLFIGKRGPTYGWQETLDNYKIGYPDRAAMGYLTFTILSVELHSSELAFVVGKWELARELDRPSGHFTLLWKKIRGEWVIIADHSS